MTCENFTQVQEGIFVSTKGCDWEMSNQEGDTRFLIGIRRKPDKETDCGNEGAKNLRLKKREKPKLTLRNIKRTPQEKTILVTGHGDL
jgi:hypothetical protein